MSTGSFAKREREKAKKERAENKRERREVRRSEAGSDDAAPTRPQEEVLAALAALHQALSDGTISFDDFEDAKAELVAQLSI